MQQNEKKSMIEKMNQHRNMNLLILSKFKKVSENHANKMDFCSRSLYLSTYENTKDKEDQKNKILPNYLCRNKFCSNCAFLRSRKLFVETYQVLNNIKNVKHIDYIAYHLTLTVKNPTVKEYEYYFKLLNDAFKLMFKTTSKYKFKDFVLGYQASRETTQSPEAKARGELHPHIHILLLLKPEFIDKFRVAKMTQQQILNEWNLCLKHYDKDFPDCTQIAFKKIKNKKDVELLNNEVDIENNAIAEVSKYPVKISDLKNISEEDFYVLNLVLFGKRLITYGGIIKQVRSELKLKDDEIEDKFLGEEKYQLMKVELFRLLLSTNKYKQEKMTVEEMINFDELTKNQFFNIRNL